jgi:hypothetical protein
MNLNNPSTEAEPTGPTKNDIVAMASAAFGTRLIQNNLRSVIVEAMVAKASGQPGVGYRPIGRRTISMDRKRRLAHTLFPVRDP